MTKEIEKNIIDYYISNCKTLEQVSKVFNISSTSVSQCLKRNAIPRKLRHETRKANYTLNERYFDIIDTQEKAYWLGFLYADGCNTGKDCLSLFVSSTDILHIKKFLKSINCNINLNLRNNENIRKKKGWKNAKDTVGFFIYNKNLTKNLNSLGCTPKKTFNLKFPTDSQVPKRLLSHFVRGYFDGDGCIAFSLDKRKGRVYKKPKYEINIIGTLDFLESMNNYLSENNISGKISKHKSVYQYRIYGNLNCKKFLDLIYFQSNYHLTRKYHKYLEFNEMAQLFD